MTDNEKKYLLELLMKSYEGRISPDEKRAVNDFIKTCPEAAELYVEFFDTVSGLVDLSEMEITLPDDDSGLDLWINFLAQDEKFAPAIKVTDERHEKERIDKVIYTTPAHRISKRNLYAAVLSAAALLFLVLLVRFVPEHNLHEVVTLTDNMNAEWINASPEKGARLLSDGTPRLLQKGLIELLFDTNARVVIEGPASFEILAEDRIGLEYGRVFASIPQEAIGFSIYTDGAKVVDLGTEFGLEVDSLGDTYLHMIKGKTRLIAGDNSNPISLEISEGTAKKVSAGTQALLDISCDKGHFARAFDTKNKIIWRQQPSLDLADIVRGGNGLGTGNSRVRLSPVKGYTYGYHEGFVTIEDYLPIPEMPFIDGIFVPDGSRKQVISSRGDLFADCPDTSGIVDMDLLASPEPEIFKTELRSGTIFFNGVEYSSAGKPCIVMHANHGITFDLDAVRRQYSRTITRFTARVGIADLDEQCPCNADFWVLVDGEVRYSLEQYKRKGILNDVSVTLTDTDRFLTLVSTDGGDPDNPEGDFYHRAISCDWCTFTEPRLELR